MSLLNFLFKSKKKPSVTFYYDIPRDICDKINPKTGRRGGEWVNTSLYCKTWNSLHPDEQYKWIDYPNTYSKNYSKGFFNSSDLAPLAEVMHRNGIRIERTDLGEEIKGKYIYPLSFGASSISYSITRWGANLFDNVKDFVVEDINNGKCLMILFDIDDPESHVIEPWCWEKLDVLLSTAGIDPSKVIFVTRNFGDSYVATASTEMEVITWDYFACAEKIRNCENPPWPFNEKNTGYVDNVKQKYEDILNYNPSNPFINKFKNNMKRFGIDPTFGGKIEIVYGNGKGTGYPEGLLDGCCTFPLKLLNCMSQKKPFIYVSDDNLIDKMRELNYSVYFGWNCEYAMIDDSNKRLHYLTMLFRELQDKEDKIDELLEKSKVTVDANYDALNRAVPEQQLINRIVDFYFGENVYEDRIS